MSGTKPELFLPHCTAQSLKIIQQCQTLALEMQRGFFLKSVICWQCEIADGTKKFSNFSSNVSENSHFKLILAILYSDNCKNRALDTKTCDHPGSFGCHSVTV